MKPSISIHMFYSASLTARLRIKNVSSRMMKYGAHLAIAAWYGHTASDANANWMQKFLHPM